MDNTAFLDHWKKLSGTSLGSTGWLTIDQTRIDAFADTTLDYQAIHTDPQASATQAQGGTIAHGYLSLSLLSFLINQLISNHTDDRTILNYGLNKVRFLHPVASGSDVRLQLSVACVEQKTKGVLVTLANTLEIKNTETPALFAEKLILILNR